MDAYEYTQSKMPASPSGKSPCFGVSTREAAKRLRELADALERSEVSLQSVQIATLATSQDFVSTSVRMVLSEFRNKDEEGRVLPGAVSVGNG